MEFRVKMRYMDSAFSNEYWILVGQGSKEAGFHRVERQLPFLGRFSPDLSEKLGGLEGLAASVGKRAKSRATETLVVRNVGGDGLGPRH
jgi:hypothetical protein